MCEVLSKGCRPGKSQDPWCWNSRHGKLSGSLVLALVVPANLTKNSLKTLLRKGGAQAASFSPPQQKIKNKLNLPGVGDGRRQRVIKLSPTKFFFKNQKKLKPWSKVCICENLRQRILLSYSFFSLTVCANAQMTIFTKILNTGVHTASLEIPVLIH